MSLLYSCSTKSKIRLFALVFFLLGVHVSVALGAPGTVEIKLGQTTYQVELALTTAQRRLGLMHREQLASNSGMLLVYPQPGDHRVWMKNMRIPLRVLWIDDDHQVLHIERLNPCHASPCPVYSAPLPARFILELSDDDHDVQPGDKIEGLNDL